MVFLQQFVVQTHICHCCVDYVTSSPLFWDRWVMSFWRYFRFNHALLFDKRTWYRFFSVQFFRVPQRLQRCLRHLRLQRLFVYGAWFIRQTEHRFWTPMHILELDEWRFVFFTVLLLLAGLWTFHLSFSYEQTHLLKSEAGKRFLLRVFYCLWILHTLWLPFRLLYDNAFEDLGLEFREHLRVISSVCHFYALGW